MKTSTYLATAKTCLCLIISLAFIGMARAQSTEPCVEVMDDFNDGIYTWGQDDEAGADANEVVLSPGNGVFIFSGDAPALNPDNIGSAFGDFYYIDRNFGPTPGSTLEARVDVVRINTNDLFGGLFYWDGSSQGYMFGVDHDEIFILKAYVGRGAWFYWEDATLRNTNVTLALSLTPLDSNLLIRGQILDPENGNEILFDRTYIDTSASDPVLPDRSRKGIRMEIDNGGPSINTVGLWGLFGWNSVNESRASYEIVYDNFKVSECPFPVLAIGAGSELGSFIISWSRLGNFRVQEASAVEGPYEFMLGTVSTVQNHSEMTVAESDSQQYFRLKRFQPLTIKSQPLSQNVLLGSNVTFRVTALGEGTLRYQWQRNGVDLVDATDATYTITDAQLDDADNYTVVVSDVFGSITSDTAVLNVVVLPTFIQHPQSQTVSVGATVTFSATVTNTATLPVGYRWRKGSVPQTTMVLESHTSSYTIEDVQLEDEGIYTVVVTNAAIITPGLLSEQATLTVEP